MGNLDIEIYMTNFKGFFDKNPDQLRQLIGDIVMPHMQHHMGLICMN